MRVSARWLAAAFVFAFLPEPSTALAQTLPSVDLRTWHPSTDPEADLVLEPVTTPGPFQGNFAAWTHYAQAPIALRDPTGKTADVHAVGHLVGADLAAGIGLGDRAALGFDLPFFLWQDGDKGLPAGVASASTVPTTGLGDLGFEGKVTLLSNDRQGLHGGFGLAARGSVTLPTGDEKSFLGEGSATVSLGVLAEYALGVAGVRASLGFLFRPDHRTWPSPSVAGSVTFGDEIPWAIGLSLRPKALAPAVDSDDRQSWELALHGSLPAGPVAPFGLGAAGASSLSPVLVSADDRVGLGHDRDTYLVIGAEVGLDHAYGVPDVRAVLSFGWAPRVHDRDGDGVPDDVDECPDLPEDRDGIQDSDGCPEDDADGDGVPDVQDACPLVAGPARGDPRTNGCPEPP